MVKEDACIHEENGAKKARHYLTMHKKRRFISYIRRLLIRPFVEAFGAERCMWDNDSGGPIEMENPEQDYLATIRFDDRSAASDPQVIEMSQREKSLSKGVTVCPHQNTGLR